MFFVNFARIIAAPCVGYFGCMSLAAFCHGQNGALLTFGAAFFLAVSVSLLATALIPFAITRSDRG